MEKKKYNARFPPARIKKIMQTDEDVGKVAQPVPVIISRALELFVENLLKKANDITSQRGARTLTPSHLKMCIKSEKRFDFLKELVSSVPDVQGDDDSEPPAGGAASTGAVGLDLTMSTLTAAAAANEENTKNTSTLPASARPSKFPRQLSTPRPRGRPRTVSLDSESKIPKKRKKKRQPKYVDDDFSGSDMSNGEEVFENDTESALPSSISATTSEGQGSGNSNTAMVPRGGFSNASSKNNEAIVTCTVTTGLTHQFNGYNNGSILGFTLSIPSTSMSESNPVGSHGLSNTALSSSTFTSSHHLKKSNGLSSSTSKSGSGALCDFTEKITHEKKKEPFSEAALVIQDEKQKNTVQDEVDEDYDDY